MFTGFKMKTPVYDVFLPQTKKQFVLKSLSVGDEESLKGSVLSPLKITGHINRCIYDSIVEFPEDIKDFKDFTKNITIKDRDALLYGLYHISYGGIRNYDIVCDSCRQTYSVSIDIENTFNINIYPHDNILNQTVKVQLPILTDVSVYIKQPTLDDEITSLKSLINRPGSTMDAITDTLIIDRFEEEDETSKTPIIYNDRIDILDAYKSLPSKDKRQIYKEYYDNFGQYCISLKMASFCTHCGKNQEVADINLLEQFFRMVFSAE